MLREIYRSEVSISSLGLLWCVNNVNIHVNSYSSTAALLYEVLRYNIPIYQGGGWSSCDQYIERKTENMSHLSLSTTAVVVSIAASVGTAAVLCCAVHQEDANNGCIELIDRVCARARVSVPYLSRIIRRRSLMVLHFYVHCCTRSTPLLGE